MKQLIQSVGSGELSVVDVPAPLVSPRGILVRTYASVVSAGTERTVTTFARKNLLQKARSRPDLVRQTLQKVKRDGVLNTIDAVRNRLSQPMTLGYSAAGEVVEVGPEIRDLRVGDRVACAGAGFAAHAQIISIPRNLAVLIPDGVSHEEAAFCTVGAIALHGIRLAQVGLSDVVAVIGLGLLGQLSIQILKAAGCTVVGIDPQHGRADLARQFGIRWAGTDSAEFAARVSAASNGHGADAVLITADTSSDEPVALAGQVARNRAVVISVGAVGTRLPRKIYFEKELEFRVSRSYGPGRYDAEYEQKGHDYPYGFVRWTENRNMMAFVSMLSAGQVTVAPLITHRFDILEGTKAYDLILGLTQEPFLGVVLRYADEPDVSRRVDVGVARPARSATSRDEVVVGVVGAGLFATTILIPVLKRTAGVRLAGVSSGAGVTARSAAERFGFDYCAASAEELFADQSVNTVAILTRHDLHARQVEAALRAGKHVFVEKPLCLTKEELAQVISAQTDASADQMLMVGFNRRFSPMTVALRAALHEVREPLMLMCRVNAGFIPREHWTQDLQQGGGRLRGEACHFIDLLIHLAGDRVARVTTRQIPDSSRYSQDNFQVTLEFEKGSVGTLVYVASGSRALGKECLEVFGGGFAARIDDYHALDIYGGRGSKRIRSRLRQDKGHRGEWESIVQYVAGRGDLPISFEEIVHSTRVTLAAFASQQSGAPVNVDY